MHIHSSKTRHCCICACKIGWLKLEVKPAIKTGIGCKGERCSCLFFVAASSAFGFHGGTYTGVLEASGVPVIDESLLFD